MRRLRGRRHVCRLGIPAAVALAAACGRSGTPEPGPEGPRVPATPLPFTVPFVVTQPGTVVNVCARVVLATGGTLTLASDSSGAFTPGVSIAVMQVQDDFAAAGDGAAMALVASAGTFAVSEIASVDPIVLATPLASRFASAGTRTAQACTIPELVEVVVTASASIVAPAWNGTSGGFVGVSVAGALRVDGAITADGAGFRGGLEYGNGGGADETSIVSAELTHYGGIGEGLDRRGWQEIGVGNRANGGGGGGCYNSGGGGGGSAGAGGFGASQRDPEAVNPATAGRGGAKLVAAGRIAFGGGGGAGHQNQQVGGLGGAGGGIVFVRAGRLEGAGRLSSDGAGGGDTANPSGDVDGAGGGGAGGTVSIIAGGGTFAGVVRASGGRGGDSSVNGANREGLGGGGGGGSVRVEGLPTILVVTSGGRPGRSPNGNEHDAKPGEPGVSVVP